MMTRIDVNIGPATAHSLREIAAQEGIDPAVVVDQAVAVWTQLRGDDERKRVGLVAMGVVVDRLREQARGAAA